MHSSRLPTQFVAVEDTRIEVFDRNIKQNIWCDYLMSAKEVCKHFGITKGQLSRAVKRGEFPKATTLGPGNQPRWANTIIDRVKRID